MMELIEYPMSMNLNSKEGNITNVAVYGMEASILASGYPMETDIGEDIMAEDWTGEHYRRAKKLGKAPSGSGHDCYLKGIIVQFDWNLSFIAQRQELRYHFIDIISSQSTMHKALQLNVSEQCNEYVWVSTINDLQRGIDLYNQMLKEGKTKKELLPLELEILYNIPSGYCLTARYTTNYLQLKTMYLQRRHHKLPEWQEFCRWCEGLPNFLNLIGVDEECL